MPSIQESLPTRPLREALAGGLRVLSADGAVSFQPYVRRANPIDGFVYWVNAKLLTATQLKASGLSSATPVQVQGSLHYSGELNQEEDRTIVVSNVIFQTLEEVKILGTTAPGLLFVATSLSGSVPYRFSFARQDPFYDQESVFHYSGHALYSTLTPQLIDTMDGFETLPVVSNSLPFWLQLSGLSQPLLYLTPPRVPLYPSFLVPDNLTPPYGSVHVQPDGTRTLQAFALRDRNNNRSQLMTDRVRVTLYGLRSDDAQTWLDYITDWTTIAQGFGLMSAPALRDGKAQQPEIEALAMQKIVDFDVSYNMSAARDVARQLVKIALLGDDDPLPGVVAIDEPIRPPPN